MFMRIGSDEIFFSNGDRYLGEVIGIQNKEPHGSGTCNYANGERYEGFWKNGIPSGKGIYYYANGERYDGFWKNGAPSGKGIYFFLNGEGSGGEWGNGELIRITKKIFTNGDCYEGEFTNNLPDGQGKMIYSDGKIFQGIFKDGKWGYPGLYTLVSGKSYPVTETLGMEFEEERAIFRSQKNREPDWKKESEDFEDTMKEWIKDKYLDPEIYFNEEINTSHSDDKFTEEEIIELAELNPGYGLRRFVKILYPKSKNKLMKKYEYNFTMLFQDFKEAFGIDLLNHLVDKRYSKIVSGDEYLKITGEKSVPTGYGNSGGGVRIPLKPQEFIWGDITPENERTYNSI